LGKVGWADLRAGGAGVGGEESAELPAIGAIWTVFGSITTAPFGKVSTVINSPGFNS